MSLAALRRIALVGIVVSIAVYALARFSRPPQAVTDAAAAFRRGDTAAAVSGLDKSLGNSHDAQDYLTAAALCEANSQWELASRYAKEGIDSCNDATPDERAQLFDALSAATAETEPRPQPQAIEAAERANQVNPESAATENALGYLLADNDVDLPRARTLLTNALDRARSEQGSAEGDAQLASVLDSYGWLMVKLHSVSQAQDALAGAASMASRDEVTGPAGRTIFFHLGVAYAMAGRLPEAREAYLTALRYDPQYRLAQVALARIQPSTPRQAPTVQGSAPRGQGKPAPATGAETAGRRT